MAIEKLKEYSEHLHILHLHSPINILSPSFYLFHSFHIPVYTYICICGVQGLDHLNVSCRYHVTLVLQYKFPKNKDIFLHNHETMITFSHIIKPQKFNIDSVSTYSPYSDFPNCPNNVLNCCACGMCICGSRSNQSSLAFSLL